jgi:hypothetical protein
LLLLFIVSILEEEDLGAPQIMVAGMCGGHHDAILVEIVGPRHVGFHCWLTDLLTD